MRAPAIVVVVLGLGFSAVCALVSEAQNPSNGLSNRFVVSATRALRAIEIDTSIPVLGEDPASAGPASSLIHDAEANAESLQEQEVVQLLRQIYTQKRADNVEGRSPAERKSTGANAYLHTQQACFSAVEALLRAKRFDGTRGVCETWIGPTVLVAQTPALSSPDAAPSAAVRESTAAGEQTPTGDRSATSSSSKENTVSIQKGNSPP